MKWIFLFFGYFQFIISSKKFNIKQQSFNKDGIQFLFKLKNIKLFLPTFTYKSIQDINVMKLHQNKIKGLIFDKDNTITKPYHNEINRDIFQFLKQANQVCFPSIISISFISFIFFTYLIIF